MEDYIKNKFSDTQRSSMMSIELFILDKFHVSPADLYSHKRNKEIAHARFVAYYLAYKHLNMYKPQIARVFNRDYSSITHGLEKVEKSGVGEEILRQFKERG